MKKFFKRTAIVLVSLFVIYIVLCFFGPSKMSVECTTDIKAPQETVMSKLGDFKFFVENWSPFTELDTNMTATYEGTPNVVGHKYTWKGNDKVKSGTMTLDSISSDKDIVTMEFEGMGPSKVWFGAKADTDGTSATWGMTADFGFMMRGMMLFMNMNKMMGDQFDKGLAMLKKNLESQPVVETGTKYEIKEGDWTEKTYFGKRATNKMTEMSAFYMKNFPAIGADLGKNKIEMAGPPSGLFWTWDETTGTTDMAAVMPVANSVKEIKGWEKFVVPAGKSFSIDYYGGYSGMKPPHDALGNYVKEKNANLSLVVEEYLTDPGVEKDSTKWLTRITYVLK